MRRRLLPLVVAVALLCLGAEPASAACPGAGTAPSASTMPGVKAATLCLLNERRAQAGLPALASDRLLEDAATRFSARMVAERFFSHDGPDGTDLGDRLRASGLPERPVGMVDRREHRLRHRQLRHRLLDRAEVDGVAGPPREHPVGALPGHRNRDRGRQPAVVLRRYLHHGLRERRALGRLADARRPRPPRRSRLPQTAPRKPAKKRRKATRSKRARRANCRRIRRSRRATRAQKRRCARARRGHARRRRR